MQINRKQLYVRYRQIRRKLNYSHTNAIKALARLYHIRPETMAFEVSLAKAGKAEDASDVLYSVMTENPFNVY